MGGNRRAEGEIVDGAELVEHQLAVAVEEQQRWSATHAIRAHRLRNRVVRRRGVDSDRERQAVLVDEGLEDLGSALSLMVFENGVESDDDQISFSNNAHHVGSPQHPDRRHRDQSKPHDQPERGADPVPDDP